MVTVLAPKKESRRRHGRSGWWFDVFEEMERMDRLMDDMMRKAVEMPLESTDRSLKIRVDSAKRRYLKELDLGHLVDPRTAKATYKNGVLEVRFIKSDEKKPSRPIQIE